MHMPCELSSSEPFHSLTYLQYVSNLSDQNLLYTCHTPFKLTFYNSFSHVRYNSQLAGRNYGSERYIPSTHSFSSCIHVYICSLFSIDKRVEW
jgi:hypothetical protein